MFLYFCQINQKEKEDAKASSFIVFTKKLHNHNRSEVLRYRRHIQESQNALQALSRHSILRQFLKQ